MGCKEPLCPESSAQPGNLGICWKLLIWSSFFKLEEGWDFSCLLKFLNNRIVTLTERKRNEKLLILLHALLICSAGGGLHELVQCLSIQLRVTLMVFLVVKHAVMLSFSVSQLLYFSFHLLNKTRSELHGPVCLTNNAFLEHIMWWLQIFLCRKLCVTTVWRISSTSRNHTWALGPGLISPQRWIGLSDRILLSDGSITAHLKWPLLIKHLKNSYASPETSQKSLTSCYSFLILAWYLTSLSCSLDGHFITFSLVVSCR